MRVFIPFSDSCLTLDIIVKGPSSNIAQPLTFLLRVDLRPFHLPITAALRPWFDPRRGSLWQGTFGLEHLDHARAKRKQMGLVPPEDSVAFRSNLGQETMRIQPNALSALSSLESLPLLRTLAVQNATAASLIGSSRMR